MGAVSELECLSVEIDTNWVRDGRGRLRCERVPEPVPAPPLVIATAPAGRTMALGAALPDPTAIALEALFAQEPPVGDTDAAPAFADRYVELVSAAVGDVAVGRVPCFVVDERARADCDQPVWTSLTSEPHALRPYVPLEHVDEQRGPWAAVAADGRPVSVCSTARSFEGGAEAGTWTEPSYRGRGYAAAATVAWASLLAPSGRLLFYCTDDTNWSSRGVAARLNLHSIGWMWKLMPRSTTGTGTAGRPVTTR